ncbi:O-antigen ligase family protein [Sphingobium sufflavum]|uniref:O-antigen ligase family protein n=1 Tax=Sphingobium sufflavum TaxID=1129547 RepID=UPI001F1A4A99|nr:O-antigen ligase family protein [Sphingobium sufflavum]MCE7798535.1 O-antigen ligase family protein [Sphingobium sufflavum]
MKFPALLRRRSRENGEGGAASTARSRPDPAAASPILGRYRNIHKTDVRHARMLYTLGILCFIYGGLFTLVGTVLLLPLLIPVIILAALVIWLLPDTGRPPLRPVEFLLFAFLIALLCWPDYLGLDLPGLPWITAVRLVGIPLALLMLISLSVSSQFRARMLEVMNISPLIWRAMVAFVVLSLVSLVFSRNPANSISKFFVAQLYWTSMFFVSLYVFSLPGRLDKLQKFVILIAIFVSFIGLWEWKLQAVPWAGHIPDILKIEDPVVQKILSFRARAASGIYRIQSKFTTPLGFAEYLAFATPFVIHACVAARQLWAKVAVAAIIPLIFYNIILTDSRLGVVGFGISFLLYLLAWGFLRWRRQKASMLGTLILVAYPFVAVSFFAATFFVHRLKLMVWGGGAQSFSTASRQEQVSMALPQIFSHPWGFGIGQGAQTLDFRNLAGELTIDSYYLVVALEYGVVGFLLYYGMFLYAIYLAGRTIFRVNSAEAFNLVPLAITLVNFIVIKSIFAQQENHPLIFIILGAIIATMWRIEKQTPGSVLPLPPVPEVAAKPAPLRPKMALY